MSDVDEIDHPSWDQIVRSLEGRNTSNNWMMIDYLRTDLPNMFAAAEEAVSILVRIIDSPMLGDFFAGREATEIVHNSFLSGFLTARFLATASGDAEDMDPEPDVAAVIVPPSELAGEPSLGKEWIARRMAMFSDTERAVLSAAERIHPQAEALASRDLSDLIPGFGWPPPVTFTTTFAFCCGATSGALVRGRVPN